MPSAICGKVPSSGDGLGVSDATSSQVQKVVGESFNSARVWRQSSAECHFSHV